MEDQKIKEKGMKLTFGPCNDDQKSEVTGTGTNEYGEFTMKGTYDQSTSTLQCTKQYAGDDNEDEDDDAAFDEAEAPEDGEAQALEDEANMPIEELMKRYRRGPDGGSTSPAEEPAAKKQKVDDEEEQYDEF